jgi:hypothetical protein
VHAFDVLGDPVRRHYSVNPAGLRDVTLSSEAWRDASIAAAISRVVAAES